MRIRNSKRWRTESSRKIGVVLLLAYLALGAGMATTSVLCLGEDGHWAVESAASCVICVVRADLPGQKESMTPAWDLLAGDACGSCRDYSISSANVFSGVSVPFPSRSDRGHVALHLLERVERPWSPVPSASSVSGPPEPRDPTALHTRPVVLLI